MTDEKISAGKAAEDSPDIESDVGINLYGQRIRQADVEEFFNEKFDSDECSICKNGTYFPYLYAPDNKRFAAVVSIKILGEKASLERGRFKFDDERFVPIYTVHCDSCGHVRQHTIFAVAEWLREKGEG